MGQQFDRAIEPYRKPGQVKYAEEGIKSRLRGEDEVKGE